MFACLDVDYRAQGAVAACLLFERFTDEKALRELVEHIPHVEPYQPGEFFRRELPCLLTVLGKVSEPLFAVIIDGYVWLSSEKRPGLGAHLYEALQGKIPVIGVAKTRFYGADLAIPVIRGQSKQPLLVTAAGMDPKVAAEQVQKMHGEFRVPTLLKRVDRLCREG